MSQNNRNFPPSEYYYAIKFPKKLYKYVSYINELSVSNGQIYEIAKATIHTILINLHASWSGRSPEISKVYITCNEDLKLIQHYSLLQFYSKYLIPLEIFRSLPNSPEIQSLFPALNNGERYYFDKSTLQMYLIDPDLIFHYSSQNRIFLCILKNLYPKR